jgi:hypothetical protein
MPTYRKRYKIEFTNAEDQLVKIFISDTLSGDANPYNINMQIIDAGGGNILVRCFFNNLTPDVTGVSAGYSEDGGATYVHSAASLISPIEFTIPNTTQYLYQVIVYKPTGNEIFNLHELDGEEEEWLAEEDALHLVVNNDESNLLASIYGLQAIFKVKQEGENYLLNKLLRGTYSDRRYHVEITIEDRLVFRGFLSLGEMEEPFMPEPVITFTATDQLGALKNKTLLDFNDSNPKNKHKVIAFLAWCLRLTGIEQNIHVVCNLRSEFSGTLNSTPADHIFNTEYLDAKTFESEINESEDAYTALQKILKHYAVVGQRHGEWWIKAIDEFDQYGDHVAVFSSLGEFVEMQAETNYRKNIGIDESINWMNEAQAVAFSSPSKFAKHTLRYEFPKELPCNVNFERGDLVETVSENDKHYELECWEPYRANYPTSDLIAATTDAYIRRVFENGYEKERYVVIESSSSPSSNLIMSEPVYMNVRDKFTLSLSRRLSADVSGADAEETFAQVRLYADDGTRYTLGGGNDTVEWVECNSTFTNNQRVITGITSPDTETYSASVEAPALPKKGYIRILLYQSSEYGTTRDSYIDPPSFTYIPFVNGSYQVYTGHSHKSYNNADNIEKVDEEVNIGDVPVFEMKGGFFRWDGLNYQLSGRYYNSIFYPDGPPSGDQKKPFGWHQNIAVWNQVRLLRRIFRGPLFGIDSSEVDVQGKCDIPTIFHHYYMTDEDEHSNSKIFRLTNYDMDVKLCRFANAAFKETLGEAGKTLIDPYEFKYISR